jgi:hypothetical protein
VLQSGGAAKTSPAPLGPNTSALAFRIVAGGWPMLTVIIIVAIVLVLLYLMRDRLTALRR